MMGVEGRHLQTACSLSPMCAQACRASLRACLQMPCRPASKRTCAVARACHRAGAKPWECCSGRGCCRVGGRGADLCWAWRVCFLWVLHPGTRRRRNCSTCRGTRTYCRAACRTDRCAHPACALVRLTQHTLCCQGSGYACVHTHDHIRLSTGLRPAARLGFRRCLVSPPTLFFSFVCAYACLSVGG